MSRLQHVLDPPAEAGMPGARGARGCHHRKPLRIGLLVTATCVALVLAPGKGAWSSPGPPPDARIYRVSVDSGGAQGGFYSPSAYPALSSDGRHVAFWGILLGSANDTDIFVHDLAAATTVGLKLPPQDWFRIQGLSLSGDSLSISADGRWVAFGGSYSDPAGTKRVDAFVFDRDADGNGVFDEYPAGTAIAIASVTPAGAAGGGGTATVSPDGRWVAFTSGASDLVPGDTNGHGDTFVRDMIQGTTARVSLSSEDAEGGCFGVQYPCGSGPFGISADGRFVGFTSSASNLVPGDTNGTWDVFVRDRDLDADGVFDEPGAVSTHRASVSSEGEGASEASIGTSMSSSGRVVAFNSWAPNLVQGDTQYSPDVFVRDLTAGTTELASVFPDGRIHRGESGPGALSADGRLVVFIDDADFGQRVFLRDRVAGTTTRVPITAPDGGPPDGSFMVPALSPDGTAVGFTSLASNLVPGDTNDLWDVFVLDGLRCPNGKAPQGPVSGPLHEREDTHAQTYFGGAGARWAIRGAACAATDVENPYP